MEVMLRHWRADPTYDGSLASLVKNWLVPSGIHDCGYDLDSRCACAAGMVGEITISDNYACRLAHHGIDLVPEYRANDSIRRKPVTMKQRIVVLSDKRTSLAHQGPFEPPRQKRKQFSLHPIQIVRIRVPRTANPLHVIERSQGSCGREPAREQGADVFIGQQGATIDDDTEPIEAW